MAPALGMHRWLVVATVPVAGATVGIAAGVDPVLGLSIALATCFVVVLLNDLALGLAAFTFLTFVAAVPSFGGPAVSVVKAAGFVIVLSWLAALAGRVEGRPRLEALPLGVAFTALALIAWAAISSTWAEDQGEALTAASRLGLDAILLAVVATVIRTHDQVIAVFAAFVLGAVVSALYGLLFAPPADFNELERLTGAIDNPNELAALLATAIVFCVALLAVLPRSWPLIRVGLWGAAAFCLAAVMMTGSRGGLAALAFAVLATLFYGRRLRSRLALIALAAIAAGGMYFSSLASPEVREHVSSVGSGSGRLDLWQVGWRMVEDEPIRGVGAGNFPTSSVHYVLEPGSIDPESFSLIGKPQVAHNTYLEVFAELGVIGIGLFLAVVGACLHAAGRAATRFARGGDARGEVLARALTVAIVATLVADIFGSRQYEKELWILLGLGLAMRAIASRAPDDASGQPADTRSASARAQPVPA